MDTWATSSCSPLIIGRWVDDPAWFAQHFPASMRPQAHDIIRTWAFYSIVKSLYHTGTIPWHDLMISGFGLSAERHKLSKSREHHESGPMAIIEQESADALRYWATAGRIGADSPYNAETVTAGRRLVTKLWNASRFAENRLQQFSYDAAMPETLLPTDRWLLAHLARCIGAASAELEQYEYAAARAAVERFFWSDLCDNYLELAKARLYGTSGPEQYAAQWSLYHALFGVLQLLAPFLPYITEEIYQGLFRRWHSDASIHGTAWPSAPAAWIDEQAEAVGEITLEILRHVRRYKAEQGWSVGAVLEMLHISVPAEHYAALSRLLVDLQSATRAKQIDLEIGMLDIRL